MLKKSPNIRPKNIIYSLSHLIFPKYCLICEKELTRSKKSVCTFCHLQLPFTYFENYSGANETEKLFWGRIEITTAYSLLYFEHDNITQTLLHQLKYKSQTNVGVEFGKILAKKLTTTSQLMGIDALIPVPLHPKKQFIRGYNQSQLIAEGFAAVTAIKIDDKLVKRTHFTESQTKKTRFDRWDNVNKMFIVDAKNLQNYKHIALIDDIITTGATLEAISAAIKCIHPTIQISIFTIAIAK